MRILHVARNLLPHISGSTIRSKYILKYQKHFSLPFAFETDFQRTYNKNFEIIDGIPYFRLTNNFKIILRVFKKLNNLFIKMRSIISIYLRYIIMDFIIYPLISLNIKKLISFYDIELVHVHSDYDISKPLIKICRKKKIPFVYEVRGFLELNFLSIKQEKNKKYNYYHYKSIIQKETEILRKADLIITLSNSMKLRIINRKISEEKIKIIPNCTDLNLKEFEKCSENLMAKYNKKEGNIIGFIGILKPYEGLEYLIQAVKDIALTKNDIKILLIGYGYSKYMKKLKKLIKELNVEKHIQFTGRIPHSEISKYYSLLDIIILPRINSKVCRIVTPLKPVEAMYHKTLVLASDLPALRYFIIPEKTGDVFIPENPKDISRKVIFYLNNTEIKKQIEENAFEYVNKNFLWHRVVPKYKKYYTKLLGKTH